MVQRHKPGYSCSDHVEPFPRAKHATPQKFGYLRHLFKLLFENSLASVDAIQPNAISGAREYVYATHENQMPLQEAHFKTTNLRIGTHNNGRKMAFHSPSLTSNTLRRDIWHGDDMAGDGELRANWNKALVEELAASCYSRVLIAAKGVLGSGEAYEALWPTGQTVVGSMWRNLSDSLMRIVNLLPLLSTRLQGVGWVTPKKCVVWTTRGVGNDRDESGGEDDEEEQRALAEVLLAEKVRSKSLIDAGGFCVVFSSYLDFQDSLFLA